MRSFLAVIGLVATFGFTGSAVAGGILASIDLRWDTVNGPTSKTIAASETAVLNLILTHQSANIGGSITVDYSAVVAFADLDRQPGAMLPCTFDSTGVGDDCGFTNNPNIGLDPLPLSLGPSIDNGMEIESFNAGALPPYVGTGLAAGQSYLLGTMTFVGSVDGSADITPVFRLNDSVNLGVGLPGSVPQSQVSLGSATLTVPEPSMIATSITAGLVLMGSYWRGRKN